MEEKREQMKEWIATLNQAARAYYQESREILSNLEYDALYDKLAAMEKETGIVLAGSPTMHVGYEVLSDLPRETHSMPMLSLDKTKELDQLKSWLGEQPGVLSWKMDGLTIVLTYREGSLYKAVTRGNGSVGEVVTANARVFANLPVTIPFKGELVLRGEAFIRYSDFEKLNQSIEDVDARYKNPRNLCSGSVRQLNNEVTAQRNVHFAAFSLVMAEGLAETTREAQFQWLQQQGFEVVEYRKVDQQNLEQTVEWFSQEIAHNDIPSDGLVLMFNDIAYGKSLGSTAKFPRDSIAFKWRDEMKETVLEEIEWSASRTGLINPVAIFEPVELEGTTVTRASVHNVSIVRELELGIGDRIQVYKANMIIPQIAENLTRSGNLEIPSICPVCGGAAEIEQDREVQALYCTNPQCQAKQIKSFTHFVSRNAMNIEGLSEATLQKFIGIGIITEPADIFTLEKHRAQIVEMEGFGEKSFERLMKAIEAARETTPARLLYSLGIVNIGVAVARLIAESCKNQWAVMAELTVDDLVAIDGIGEVMAEGYTAYFADEGNREKLSHILQQIHLDESWEEREDLPLDGIIFVITGKLKQYENRDALKKRIQENGGKVAGSVSSKTGYLINNDAASSSSKNKKAKELDVPIITEEEFQDLLQKI